MIWSDPCSDMFFHAFELSVTWIASLQALESAAGVGLGYLDFQVRHHKDDALTFAMRKKRLAFAKFSFIMSISTLMMLDPLSEMCLLPILIGSAWTALKMGTQIGHNLTPDRFYSPRLFLAMYNLLFILMIWYKMHKAKGEKIDLELSFFNRVEGIMLIM